ncbi:hypothetical protein ASPVEDRAFT_215454 [Aspergillus versicolor CBS 583.65]|uniref:Secreted protein n=1 Tax=Aspergillus versicolor CBS 583.65 TaxID=1036611 RepID=A0A1L9P3H3_ASPVE|nr:uncharacterized protein ASPVEDRAFT_215454 [Aspergillus versicolor CBS 583.65]OJI96046.1 hypothetical protein ASPVEDRAFT_215454 [Aspergillus versicolor CBS 583.65]
MMHLEIKWCGFLVQLSPCLVRAYCHGMEGPGGLDVFFLECACIYSEPLPCYLGRPCKVWLSCRVGYVVPRVGD